ncbi:ERF family protein [[Kitasatospora] papulosa]|uniref:ERF family protein n=1 Tax=Streptomyces TaxID=1883 RepID=UPI00331BAA02
MAETTTVAEHATPQPLTVDQAMIAVMQEIGPVGKNGHNKHHDYAFRAQEDIVAAARGPMARHGLRMLPRVISHQHFTRGPMNVAILEVEYTFRGPAGDTMPPILVVGEGADPSDKASNKAMTAAKKYAYIQAFEIADGAEDGDRDSPVAVLRSPLAWYIEQINQREIWYDPEKLRILRDKAAAEGVADLDMPDKPGTTFRTVVQQRGIALLAEQEANEQRKAEQRQALHAQMSAEYPEPSESYDEWSQDVPAQRSPQRPAVPTPPPAVSAPAPWGAQPAPAPPTPPAVPVQPTPAPAAPVPPDASLIQQQFAAALADPVNGWQMLHDMRTRWGVLLAQALIHTDLWGTVDANSAVTIAIASWASLVQQPFATTGAPTPVAAPAPPAPVAAPVAPTAPVAPEPAEHAAVPPTLRLAPRTADMSAAERARANTVAELELQAQMLGVPTLEFVADLLPEGGTCVEDIMGGSRLQDHVKKHRPEVLAAFTNKGMVQAAAEYAKFGDRVPARDINKFLQNMLKVT